MQVMAARRATPLPDNFNADDHLMLIPWAARRAVSEEVGLGLFATRRIDAGTLVWVEDCLDQRLPIEQFLRLPEAMRRRAHAHAYIPGAVDYYLLCWDDAKFMNHSCEPNCMSVTPGIEIAVSDILAGEQLTCDYSGYGLEQWERFECRCGTASCAGIVSSEPRTTPRQARTVERALRKAGRREQPLAFLLSQAQREQCGLLQRGVRARGTLRLVVNA